VDRRGRILVSVISGKHKVWTPVSALVALTMATAAGRLGEDGTGAMWIAPELLALQAPSRIATECNLSAGARSQELIFEVIHLDQDELHLANDNQELVEFAWNPATGELTYRADGGSRFFTDLEALSASDAAPASCVSR
jgi:hypothetical protein